MLTQNEINGMSIEQLAEYCLERSKLDIYRNLYYAVVATFAYPNPQSPESVLQGFRIVCSKQKVKPIAQGSFYTTVVNQFRNGKACK